jgi:hypothetical protein
LTDTYAAKIVEIVVVLLLVASARAELVIKSLDGPVTDKEIAALSSICGRSHSLRRRRPRLRQA